MEKQKLTTPLGMLPEWRAKYGGDELPAAPCSRDELRTMCGCLRQYPSLEGKSRICRSLSTWYMPRHAEDVDCLVGRYRIWELLPAMVSEVITAKKEVKR